MQSTRSSRTITALAVVLGLTATGLSGCDPFGDGGARPAVAARAPPDVVTGLRDALDSRSLAVRNHDAPGFLAGLAPGDRSLRHQQRTYFDNLVQLPLGTFDYELDPASVVRDGDDYEAVVSLRTELSGFDDRPVLSRDRMRFASAGSPGRYVVASAADPDWEEAHDVRPQPWELGPVVVRALPGVLGVFDARSVHAADRLLADVRQGITDVSAVVPYEWSRSVVVYALSDPAFLASIPDLPGGDPGTLDGVAFPVAAE